VAGLTPEHEPACAGFGEGQGCLASAIDSASGALVPSPEDDLKIRQAIHREVRHIKARLQCRKALLIAQIRMLSLKMLAFRFLFSTGERARNFGRGCGDLGLYILIHLRRVLLIDRAVDK
jgi:hypothetical protein